MEKFVGKLMPVPFNSIYLDPNNPRLGRDDGPGYEDPRALFDAKVQAEVEEQVAGSYDVETLIAAIIAQGWMPIDNIVIWTYPKQPNSHIVVEGNRRTVALRKIRGPILDRERKKLERMESGKKRYTDHDLKAQRELVARLETIVADTDQLPVVPLDAANIKELEHKLPRVLAVRHITGAKGWGNFAQDLWLLKRYEQLFEDTHTKETSLFWDADLIKQLADEASLTAAEAKKLLRTAMCFSHFDAEFTDQLPEGEEFEPGDYYLFENIVRRAWVRQQLGLGEDDLHLSSWAEEVLFEWVFKLPRPANADDNQNVFYRHENVVLWDQIHRYDEKHGTAFATRLDVNDPKNVPTMRDVEAEYAAHKARKKPQAVLDELLRRLSELPAETLVNEGEFLRAQLQQLNDLSAQYLRMLDAVEV
jgi:hypothetical protein